MGNPHPTKSKPNKIGRKHTQGKRVWQKAGRERYRKIELERIKARRKRLKDKIKKYWVGELEYYPLS